MAEIQLIQCKKQQKTSSCRRNSVPYQDQGIEWWCENFNRKFISGRSCACAVKIWLKIALKAVRLPKFEPVNGISWSPRKIMVKDLRQRSGLAWFWPDIYDHWPRLKGQRSRSQRISSSNAITRQPMVVSTSNLVETFIVRYASRDTLSRSVGQLDRK